jgi:hypothetical protein
VHPALSTPQIKPAGALALALIGLTCSAAALGGSYSLASSTIDGGGQHSQGARFAVEGTIGQPDVDPASGSRFTLAGGFWPEAPVVTDTIFANRFED